MKNMRSSTELSEESQSEQATVIPTTTVSVHAPSINIQMIQSTYNSVNTAINRTETAAAATTLTNDATNSTPTTNVRVPMINIQNIRHLYDSMKQ